MRMFSNSMLTAGALMLFASSVPSGATPLNPIVIQFFAGDFSTPLTPSNDNISLGADPYSQSGYTVTQTSGDVDDNYYQGNPPPGLTSGAVIQNSPAGTCSTCTSSITIADGGAPFSLSSFQLDAVVSSVMWTITGNGGVTPFTQTGTDSTVTAAPGTYVSIDSDSGAELFTSVTLTFSDTANTAHEPYYYIDNIVADAPEPSSLILLGSGLLSVGAMARRRVFA